MTAMLILVGGGAGAVARWLITHLVTTTQRRNSTTGRWTLALATTIVNVLGSFVLGFIVGMAEGDLPPGAAPISIGVLGGFTTFSTWMVEADEAEGTTATVAVLTVPAVLGVAAATAGIAIGRL